MNELPEGLDRRLRVEAAPAAHQVQITFSDTGPGFAEPSRAFDPFYTTRHQGEGMGLGLSICYSIIREHGGDISAINMHPRGAAVVIELPIAGSEDHSELLKKTHTVAASPVMAHVPTRAI
jgi:C4-dicarboxylate-specific signal transduction histidine kinase